jgi:hypothetical protein
MPAHPDRRSAQTLGQALVLAQQGLSLYAVVVAAAVVGSGSRRATSHLRGDPADGIA